MLRAQRFLLQDHYGAASVPSSLHSKFGLCMVVKHAFHPSKKFAILRASAHLPIGLGNLSTCLPGAGSPDARKLGST